MFKMGVEPHKVVVSVDYRIGINRKTKCPKTSHKDVLFHKVLNCEVSTNNNNQNVQTKVGVVCYQISHMTNIGKKIKTQTYRDTKLVFFLQHMHLTR